MNALKDRVALVTGGSRGIGEAAAFLFAREGAHVIVNYRHGTAKANETLAKLEGDGKHLAVQADLASAADIRRMFQRIGEAYGRLDVLVNNAGVNRDAPLEQLTEAMWDEVLAVNLKGPFLCAQMAAPLMRAAGGGSIVNVSAETAIQGRVGACNYIASKAGLIGLTKALAREMAPSVRVNSIAFGYTRTDELVERLNLDNPENLANVLKQIPLARMGTVEEAAQVILFLASSASSFVTGQVLGVGGGRWM